MAARGHFVFPIDDKNHRVLVIWDLNGYGEYEFDICEKVKKLWPVQALACGGGGDGGDGGDGGATKNIISPKFSNFGDIITMADNVGSTERLRLAQRWGQWRFAIWDVRSE